MNDQGVASYLLSMADALHAISTTWSASIHTVPPSTPSYTTTTTATDVGLARSRVTGAN